MAKPKAVEQLRHFEAFEFWYWSQPRAFDKVASKFRVTARIVRVWAEKYSWEQRAQERDAKIKADISNKHDAEAVQMRANLIKVGQATLARYGARLLKDPAQRNIHGVSAYEPSASDAARWSQILLLLTGQATSRSELTVGSGFVEAFMAMVTAVLRREIPRTCPTCKTATDLPERIGRALMEASARFQAEKGGDQAALPAAATGPGPNPDADEP